MTRTASPTRCGSACVRISQLEAIAADGGRIALWGWGREGRAAWRAIRSRAPELPLTLFCNADEAADAAGLGDPRLDCDTGVDATRLSACAVVVKSPGISPYAPDAMAAAAQVEARRVGQAHAGVHQAFGLAALPVALQRGELGGAVDAGHLQRIGTGFDMHRLPAQVFQAEAECFGGRAVVFHQQYPAPRCLAGRGCDGLRGRRCALRQQGQAQRERSAQARPVAVRRERAFVLLHQVAGDGQAQAEAAETP